MTSKPQKHQQRNRGPHPRQNEKFVHSILDVDTHAERVASIANAAAGIIVAGSLAIHAIGRGKSGGKRTG